MTYLPDPKIPEPTIRKHEKAFRNFTISYVTTLLFSVAALIILSEQLKHVWQGNILYMLGSYIVFGSVLQARFFDVKKNSNPIMLILDPNSFTQLWIIIEKAFKYLWIAGSLMLFVSKWIKI